MRNNKPHPDDYASFYKTYVSKIESKDVVSVLNNALPENLKFLEGIPSEKWDFRYADGKWTIKEILLHIIDTERIFSNRALRIARNDKTPLPGFDQDAYAPYMDANNRSINSLVEEYESVRKASLTLFKNLTDEMWQRDGIASGTHITVLAIAFIIAGHEMHHFEVIRERYF